MNDEYYEDLARRLCAAATSHFIGNRSIDYTLRTHFADRPIGTYWTSLARDVSEYLLRSRDARLVGKEE